MFQRLQAILIISVLVALFVHFVHYSHRDVEVHYCMNDGFVTYYNIHSPTLNNNIDPDLFSNCKTKYMPYQTYYTTKNQLISHRR